MNEKMTNKQGSLGFATFLIFAGILISYVAQMGPAPLLTIISEDLKINLGQAGLAISIIFPALIVFCIAGGFFEKKIGVKKLYIWSLIFISIGLLMYYMVTNYITLLLGRILFGIGFGLGVPFIGAAIMKWYTPKQQEMMNTLNGLFPFIGTMIAYGAALPLFAVLGNSWRAALGIFGFVTVGVLVLWGFFIKDRVPINEEEEEEHEKNLYGNLWKRKEIKLLCITFICDFFSYAFIAGMLPTFYLETGAGMEAANQLAIIFPVSGLIGCAVGGVWMSKAGKRKPVLYTGQLLKFFGILMASLGGASMLGFIGVAIVGVGNSMWMPPMYQVPMDLPNMNATRVGATFGLISACGFVAGFIAPALGGWVAEFITLKWTLFAFAFPNLIGFTAMLIIRETGPGAKVKTILLQEQETAV